MLPPTPTIARPIRPGCPSPAAPAPVRSGFSITELLVVIGIIVLLIGILLPALGAVQQRARRTQTVSTMTGFAQACETYRAQFDSYPGVVPDRVLAADPKISGTENALLALMGGYVVQDDVGDTVFNDTSLFPAPDWVLVSFNGPDGTFNIKVNRFEIGTGPVVRGKKYAPFFSPRPSEFVAVPGQFLTDPEAVDPYAGDPLQLPDLVDGWGQPIIYMRAMRTIGPLVGPTAALDLHQFDRRTMNPYLTSRRLGERGTDQNDSIIRPGFAGVELINASLAQMIRHPGFGAPDNPLQGTARGAFVLISSGKDGVYFSRFDGPGTNADPITNLTTQIIEPGGNVIDEFDDIRTFGGG